MSMKDAPTIQSAMLQQVIDQASRKRDAAIKKALMNKGYEFGNEIERNAFLKEHATATTFEGVTTLFVAGKAICCYTELYSPVEINENKASYQVDFKFKEL